MAEEKIPTYYVCTHNEAKELIKNHNQFWVCNCGCREGLGSKCKRSRIDVCLSFTETDEASGSDKKPVDRAFAEGIMKEAETKNLITRPWRSEDRTKTEGICFCCDDCCGYFVSPGKYTCDKGKFIEKTNMEKCTHCGACVDVCYFKARKIIDDKLMVNREQCYGCSLCVTSCPVECITTVKR